MSARRSLLSLVIASGTLFAGAAFAETIRDEDNKAAGRPKEEVRKQEKGLRPPKEVLEESDQASAPDAYQPKGVDLGSFLLLPKVEVTEGYSNNIYATQYDRIGDWATLVKPEVSLKSRFDRHELGVVGRLQHNEYRNYDKENVTNAFASVNGRYDVTERDNVNASLSYVSDHEDRGSPDNAGGNRPTPFSYLTFNGSGVMTTGRVTSSLGFTAAQRQWEDVVRDGGIVPTHLRNRTDYEEKLREGYEFFPGYSALLEGVLNQRRYVHDADQFGNNRDSDGWRLSTGLGVDLSNLVRGDFLIGRFHQNYKDDNLMDPSGTFVKAAFNWTPTRMTTVIPTIERSVEETTAARVAALVRTATAVTVRHELERNVILNASAGYARDEQKGGGLTANTTDAGLRATYLFTPEVYTALEAKTQHKLTNLDGAGFNRNTFMLTLGLQY